jgi:hypothetical protein
MSFRRGTAGASIVQINRVLTILRLALKNRLAGSTHKGPALKDCWTVFYRDVNDQLGRAGGRPRRGIEMFEQKERALTSPKTSALAFISVLPWRINDGQDTSLL